MKFNKLFSLTYNERLLPDKKDFVILRKVKMPFWSVFFCGLCIIGQVLGEGILENTVLEETSEMVLYTIISVLVVYYVKKLNKTIHPKQIHQ